MPADFPDSPTPGQTFTVGTRTWTWDGTVWKLTTYGTQGPQGVQGTQGRLITSDTAPLSPSTGDMWFDSSSGNTYLWYDSFWVAWNQGAQGPQGFQGSTGAQGVTGTQGTAGAQGEAGTNGNWSTAQSINAVVLTSYTLLSSDVGQLVTLSNSSAITLYVPPDIDQTIPVGTYIDLMQLGTGQVTVTAGAGATLRISGLTAKSRAQYSRFSVQKISSNTWVVFGDMAAA